MSLKITKRMPEVAETGMTFEENARLKAELAKKSNEAATSPLTQSIMETPQAASATLTNFDILKRLNRLEKEVFGKQILNNEI